MRYPRKSYVLWRVFGGGTLCLVTLCGCQLVLPSVRTQSAPPAEVCDQPSGAANVLADAGPANPSPDPVAHPPHSKFHPVPTRPVFAPASELTWLPDVPTPAPEEPSALEPPEVDELPAPPLSTEENSSDAAPDDQQEQADDREDPLEAKGPRLIHPASVELQWIEHPAQ